MENYGYDPSVLMDSDFVFSRDSNGGFHIELMFKDYNMPDNRQVLDQFYVSQERILEMRHSFFNNAVYIEGKLQFRVYEFVKLLNTIIARNNIFDRLKQSNIDQRR